jgi:hypothetical protein
LNCNYTLQDPTAALYHRDIYNITAARARAKHQGMSLPEALISRLEAEEATGGIYFEWYADTERYIAMLFVVDIVGVNYHGNSFTVSLCWLDQEVEQNYDEAMQHLVKLFS